MDFFGKQDTILWFKNASQKVVFGKTAFVKFKTTWLVITFKNIDETDLKEPKIPRKIHTILWIYKNKNLKKKIRKSKISRLSPNLWFPIKKNP